MSVAGYGVTPRKLDVAMTEKQCSRSSEMKSIAESLPTLSSAEPLPNNAICPKCNLVLPDFPNLGTILEKRGLTRLTASRALCVCDIQARSLSQSEQRERALRIGAAELPHQGVSQTARTFANWDSNRGDAEPAKAFAEEQNSPILSILGNVGSGKSHLLEAIGRYCLDKGLSVKYIVAADLLRRVRDTFDGGKDSVLEDCYRADVLLLDDLGMENPTPWVKEQLMALVDERYRNGRRLAVATNLTPSELVACLGERLASRLSDVVTGTVQHQLLRAGDFRAS